MIRVSVSKKMSMLETVGLLLHVYNHNFFRRGITFIPPWVRPWFLDSAESDIREFVHLYYFILFYKKAKGHKGHLHRTKVHKI